MLNKSLAEQRQYEEAKKGALKKAEQVKENANTKVKEIVREAGGGGAGGAEAGGSRTGGSKAGSAKTSGAKTSGAKTSGSKTGGSKAGSAKTSGAKTSGAKTSNAETTTPIAKCHESSQGRPEAGCGK
ncbi:uncharacterized protein LOC144990316 [Oryzias latipes]